MRVNFDTLIGLTITEIVNNCDKELTFHTKEGRTFYMYHEQDCCENVYLADTGGDLKDVVGEPVLSAEKSSNNDPPLEDRDCESCTWTFYRLATNRGSICLRWFGESNGYYSEGVDFEEL